MVILYTAWWWLEPWNFMTFPSYWECHHPNWRSHIFQRGRAQPPTSEAWWRTAEFLVNQPCWIQLDSSMGRSASQANTGDHDAHLTFGLRGICWKSPALLTGHRMSWPVWGLEFRETKEFSRTGTQDAIDAANKCYWLNHFKANQINGSLKHIINGPFKWPINQIIIPIEIH
jgi:hypothetical protein